MSGEKGHSLAPYGWAPGDYVGKCRTCGEAWEGDKRCMVCRPCAEAARDADLVRLRDEVARLHRDNFRLTAERDDADRRAGAAERKQTPGPKQGGGGG
jgi:hypothetical protein